MQITARTDRGFIIDYIVDSDIRSRNFAGKEKRHPVTNTIVNGAGRKNFLLYHLPEDPALIIIFRNRQYSAKDQRVMRDQEFGFVFYGTLNSL